MLEFPHLYNLLCAHLFPGLVCSNGLPSRVAFLVIGRQGSFVRLMMLEAALFLFLPLTFSVPSSCLEWVPPLYVMVYP